MIYYNEAWIQEKRRRHTPLHMPWPINNVKYFKLYLLNNNKKNINCFQFLHMYKYVVTN